MANIKYLRISPISGAVTKTSIEREKLLNEYLRKITKANFNEGDVLKKIFITDVCQITQTAFMVVDLDYEIIVRNPAIIPSIIPLMPELTEQEISDLSAEISENSSILFADIIPSTAVYKTKQEWINEGYFLEPEA